MSDKPQPEIKQPEKTLLPAVAPSLHLQDQAQNTQTSYQRALKQFVLGGGHLPATPQQIILYLEHNLVQYSYASLQQLIAALGDWHQRHRFLDPVTDDVRRALRAAGRLLRHKPVRKAQALTYEQVTQLTAAALSGDDLRGHRDSCLMLLGFAAALRRSELVQLQCSDLQFSADGLLISLNWSKTDQTGQGQQLMLPRTGEVYCPVAATELWLEQAGITHGPLLRGISRSGQLSDRALAACSVNRILKLRAAQAGFTEQDVGQISAHSLRRGFATDAVRQGVALTDIAAVGRWQKLDTLKEYVQPDTRHAISQVLSQRRSENK